MVDSRASPVCISVRRVVCLYFRHETTSVSATQKMKLILPAKANACSLKPGNAQPSAWLQLLLLEILSDLNATLPGPGGASHLFLV